MAAATKRAKKLRKGFEVIERTLMHTKNPCRAVLYHVRGTNGKRQAIHCFQLVRNVGIAQDGTQRGVAVCPRGHADHEPRFLNPLPPSPQGRGRLKKRPHEDEEQEELA